MAAVQNSDADDSAYTFDLGDLFGEKYVKLVQLEAQIVQDSDLSDLIDSVNKNGTENVTNPNGAVNAPDAISTEDEPNQIDSQT